MSRLRAALVSALVASAPLAARADDPPPAGRRALTPPQEVEEEEPDALVWNPSWPRFHVGEYIATGAMFAGIAVGLFAVPQTVDGWKRPILFDEAVRNGTVLGNIDDRRTAVAVGDALYYGLWAYPVVVDLGIAAMAVHQSWDVAWQMFAIDAQAFALTGLVSTLTQRLVGRHRSFVQECARDPGYDEECDDEVNRNQGFISGHTAIAFAGAGLVCVHHAHLPLYGGGAADLIACSTAMLGATISGMSRVVADRHHITDVFTGAAVGVLAGYVMPELLHYRFSLPTFTSQKDGISALVLPTVGPTDWGLASPDSCEATTLAPSDA